MHNNTQEKKSISDIKYIYEIIDVFLNLFHKIFNILIELLNDKEKKNTLIQSKIKTYFQKLMSILYSYSILQNVLSEKMKMPESLINKMVEFLKFLSENNKENTNVMKSFFNHILMIVLTQQNTYNIPIDKISNFLNSLINSKEQNYYLDGYISILIEIFMNQKASKELKQILTMFINNFTDSYLIKYIIIFQQFALNDKSISEKNFENSYKLLKLIYKSKICDKTNILDKQDTEIIL